jgi:7-carboxy-7-deazaguanine synthase
VSGAATINICEIFGPTIQGEGALLGLPTVFVRTGGCDYRCSWCDTPYAVDPAYSRQWTAMTPLEILGEVRHLSGDRPLTISLSGGNPALQPLQGLIDLGRAAGYRFALETQGSVARPWFAALEVLVLSPKPPSSGMGCDVDILNGCVEAAAGALVSLKFVVRDDDDYRFAREVAARFPRLPVCLQPCNDKPRFPGGRGEADVERLRRLIAKTLSDGWFEARVLPQLHVLLWGNERGR